jgi:predicted CoA-binding protein
MNKKTLVVGASLKSDRYSNMAVIKLLNHEHDVVAYGFQDGAINGVKIDTAMITYEDIDTVTMYLSPKRQKAYYDYIISQKPKRVIFNPGTENPEFYALLQDNEIDVEVACTLVLLSTNQY